MKKIFNTPACQRIRSTPHRRWYRRLPALVKHRGALRGAPCLLFWPPQDLDPEHLAELEGAVEGEEASQRSVVQMLQAMMTVCMPCCNQSLVLLFSATTLISGLVRATAVPAAADPEGTGSSRGRERLLHGRAAPRTAAVMGRAVQRGAPGGSAPGAAGAGTPGLGGAAAGHRVFLAGTKTIVMQQ